MTVPEARAGMRALRVDSVRPEDVVRIGVVTDAVLDSVDYRLAPEHPWPAATHDAVRAVRAVAAQLGSYGGSDVLAVAGDSAGGNLVAVATQELRGQVAIAAQLLIYPATDL